MDVSIKLQKHLAQCGLGSRRHIERLINAQLITVNGIIAHQGQRISGQEIIYYDGERVCAQSKLITQVLIYHKPVKEMCTCIDPHGRRTVFAALPKCSQGRWIMVGRLDQNTSGLLLFTNNGELAHRLMHPKYNVERTYHVELSRPMSRELSKRLIQGVELSDGFAQCKRIRYLSETFDGSYQLEVVLTEGRNREVRRLFAALNFKVMRLSRKQYANVVLPQALKKSTTHVATSSQINDLCQIVGLL